MGGPRHDGTAVEHTSECRDCGSAFVWVQRGSGRPPWYCAGCRKAKKLARKQAARARQRAAAQPAMGHEATSCQRLPPFTWCSSCGCFTFVASYGAGRTTITCLRCREEKRLARRAAKHRLCAWDWRDKPHTMDAGRALELGRQQGHEPSESFAGWWCRACGAPLWQAAGWRQPGRCYPMAALRAPCPAAGS